MAGPPELMSQEDEYFAAIEKAARAESTGESGAAARELDDEGLAFDILG